MNELEILIRYFDGHRHSPISFRAGTPRRRPLGSIQVQNQISRSDGYVNLSGRAGAGLDVAAKLPVRAGPEAATVHKATYERAFEGEKRNE
jgi:hypothetical protein